MMIIGIIAIVFLALISNMFITCEHVSEWRGDASIEDHGSTPLWVASLSLV